MNDEKYYLIREGKVLNQVVMLGSGNYKNRDVIPLTFDTEKSALEVARAIKAEAIKGFAAASDAANAWKPSEVGTEEDIKSAPIEAEILNFSIPEKPQEEKKTVKKKSKKNGDANDEFPKSSA